MSDIYDKIARTSRPDEIAQLLRDMRNEFAEKSAPCPRCAAVRKALEGLEWMRDCFDVNTGTDMVSIMLLNIAIKDIREALEKGDHEKDETKNP